MTLLSIYVEKWKLRIITLGDYFGSYLRLVFAAIWLVFLWTVTYIHVQERDTNDNNWASAGVLVASKDSYVAYGISAHCSYKCTCQVERQHTCTCVYTKFVKWHHVIPLLLYMDLSGTLCHFLGDVQKITVLNLGTWVYRTCSICIYLLKLECLHPHCHSSGGPWAAGAVTTPYQSTSVSPF